VADEPEDRLRRGLGQLQATEFLYETRLFPDLEYTFRHALTHEVAYGGLLAERRRALHARIVGATERLYPDRLAEQVERLAHHAFRGELWEKAVPSLRQAGAKAAARSADREAVGYFEQALVALQRLPDSRETIEQAIDLRFDLRNVLYPLGESGRILDCLRQTVPLAEALNDRRRLVQVAGYMAACLRELGDLDDALVSAQRAWAIATALKDVGLQVAANAYLGDVYLLALSDYRRAAEVFRWSVEALHGMPLRQRFGTASIQSVYSRAHLAWCLAELGAFAEGRACGEDALRLAETVDHPYSLAVACFAVGHLSLCQGSLPQAVRVLERGLALSEAGNFTLTIRLCGARLGAAYALSGRALEALPLLERTLEQTVAMKLTTLYPPYAVRLAEGYLLSGRVAEAVPLGQQAFEVARAHKQVGHQAYALRLLGEIAAHPDPPDTDAGEDHYRQAMALTKELGMRPLLAHCHLGLGKLYRRTDKRQEAQKHLTTATTMYREMDMGFWLEQAEAEMRRLA
jgi:tetratricopeptide (TPR) repeat protein